MSTTAVRIGWKDAVVTGVEGFTSRSGSKFIRFIVEVSEATGNYTATQICKPELSIGGRIYRWMRVCGVPLAEVDESIRPSSFKGKQVKVLIEQNGEYLNIVDVKSK